LKGQAIVIPLEGQAAVIVPMAAPDGDAFTQLYTTSCDIQMGEHESSSEYFTRIVDHATPCRVDVSSLRLMHMSDRRDMSTLRVSGSARARISGTEVRIVAASVSKTAKPVTMGIREQLPWLPRYGEAISAVYLSLLQKLSATLGSGEVFASRLGQEQRSLLAPSTDRVT
jgi:hypothetical protein